MRFSLLGVLLIALTYPLGGWNVVVGYWTFGLGLVAGIAGMVVAVTGRKQPTGKRVATFVLGAIPLVIAIGVVVLIALIAHSGGLD